MTKIIVAIVGPTAIGKTTRSINLAKHFDTEIISADSRQFYKEMKVGTAVPSENELKQVKHHFIQHINIADQYSVGQFERDATVTLEKLFKNHDIVVMVGGSGLYMDAVLYGLDNFPKAPKEIRNELNILLEAKGMAVLQEQLKEFDPKYYSQVDLKNPHRLIRALEISIFSGKPYSSFLDKKKKPHGFKFVLVGLHAERDVIYDRINKRVDLMLEKGLLEEARELHPYKALNALNTVGYKELFDHFEGKMDFETAIEEIKKNTRRFAKRQLTWYRKNKDVLWLNHDLNKNEFINQIEEKIKDLKNGEG